MSDSSKLTDIIDRINYRFTSGVKRRLLTDLSRFSDKELEWLVTEHYQFSFANKGLLQAAIAATEKLKEEGVSAELRRNIAEEDGHAPMYRKGMRIAGTNVDDREEFAPTSHFLGTVGALTTGSPSRALGVLYATETAAIFEHETFFEICHEICKRRGAPWEGSLIKHFHDLHLSGGVEQGHKDGLAFFVNEEEDRSKPGKGEWIDKAELLEGARAAIDAMEKWWDALVDTVITSSSGAVAGDSAPASAPA